VVLCGFGGVLYYVQRFSLLSRHHRSVLFILPSHYHRSIVSSVTEVVLLVRWESSGRRDVMLRGVVWCCAMCGLGGVLYGGVGHIIMK